MTFKELLQSKSISGYQLSKKTNIPYMTISDLINGKTNIRNVTFKNAIAIADSLNIELRELSELDGIELVEFRYFRNNVLHDLKRRGIDPFIQLIIKTKEIDYFYKNKAFPYAYYLLALIDYLCRVNNQPLYTKRYNDIRKERLEKAFFVGGNSIHFESIEEYEQLFGIKVIPEFGKYNILEEDVFNVA